MWKRLAIIIGTLMAGTGIFLVIHEQVRNADCNSASNQIIGSRISTECLNIAAYYFTGFLLLIIGLIIVIFGLLMARKSKNYAVVRRQQPDLSQRWNTPAPDTKAKE